jgi:hypothetical protein
MRRVMHKRTKKGEIMQKSQEIKH